MVFIFLGKEVGGRGFYHTVVFQNKVLLKQVVHFFHLLLYTQHYPVISYINYKEKTTRRVGTIEEGSKTELLTIIPRARMGY